MRERCKSDTACLDGLHRIEGIEVVKKMDIGESFVWNEERENTVRVSEDSQ